MHTNVNEHLKKQRCHPIYSKFKTSHKGHDVAVSFLLISNLILSSHVFKF